MFYRIKELLISEAFNAGKSSPSISRESIFFVGFMESKAKEKGMFKAKND